MVGKNSSPTTAFVGTHTDTERLQKMQALLFMSGAYSKFSTGNRLHFIYGNKNLALLVNYPQQAVGALAPSACCGTRGSVLAEDSASAEALH